MRVSVRFEDIGYASDSALYQIFFNGEPQHPKVTGRSVITADEEAGEIVFHKFEEANGWLINGDQFAEFTEMGDVKLVRI